MGRVFLVVSAVFLLTAPPAAAVRVVVSDAEFDEDGRASVDVALETDGESVGGAQIDLFFDPRIVGLEGASSCALDPAIGDRLPACDAAPEDIVEPCKTLSRDSVDCAEGSPPGCPDGSSLHRFRGIVAAIAFPNSVPIPDGAVLFTCTFNLVDAGGLPAPVSTENVVASSPHGDRIAAEGVEGTISAFDATVPTWTRTPWPTETATASPTTSSTPTAPFEPNAALVNVISAVAHDGDDSVRIDVVLDSNGFQVTGLQHDIAFDGNIVDVASSDCTINPAISDRLDACFQDPILEPCKTLATNLGQCGGDPQPPGCPPDAGAHVEFLRAVVVALGTLNVNSIPDGLLYSCNFHLIDGGELPAELINGNIVASTALGRRVAATGRSAHIFPAGVPTWTPEPFRPSPTNTRRPTRTPAPIADGAACNPNDPARCISGNCVDRVCCRESSCPDGARCNIFGSKGTCSGQLSEDSACEKNADCSAGLLCRQSPVRGGFECTSDFATPFILATPGATPVPEIPTTDEADGLGTAAGGRAFEDDGCQLGERSPRSGSIVLLLLFGLAAARARESNSRA